MSMQQYCTEGNNFTVTIYYCLITNIFTFTHPGLITDASKQNTEQNTMQYHTLLPSQTHINNS